MAAASRGNDQSDLAAEWNSYAEDDGAADTQWSTVRRSPATGRPRTPRNLRTSGQRPARSRRRGCRRRPAPSWFRSLFPRRGARVSRPVAATAPRKSYFGLPAACAAMGALVLALVIWRGDMVRLLPQTAAFYKMVGF